VGGKSIAISIDLINKQILQQELSPRTSWTKKFLSSSLGFWFIHENRL